MKRYLQILYLHSLFAIKSMTRTPLGVVFFTFGKLLRFVMFFIFIFYLVSKTSVLKGYTVEQALIVLMTFELLNSFSGLFFREAYRFRHVIISGGLDGVLTKPYHPFLKILLGGFDILDLIVVIIQLGILGYLVYLGQYTAMNMFLYSVLFLNAFIILGALHILALSFGVITTSVDQVLWILRDVIETGRFPIEIYKQPLRWILTFLIPVGIMTTYPARGLIGLVSPQGIIVSTVIALVVLYLNLALWHKAIRRYQSWGG